MRRKLITGSIAGVATVAGLVFSASGLRTGQCVRGPGACIVVGHLPDGGERSPRQLEAGEVAKREEVFGAGCVCGGARK